MHPRFAALVERLAPKLSERTGRHLYVGRSNDLRGRYGRHCRPGATHRQAAFAFRLARIATNRLAPTYAPEGGRSWLMEQHPDPAAMRGWIARLFFGIGL